MDEAIRNLFSEDILATARERFAIAPADAKLLDSFESFIYEFAKGGQDFILRLGHSRRRTPELIHGEVDWINYLAAGGAGVAKAVLSENGALVEAIDDGQGGLFLATAFEKARGEPPRRSGRWNERMFVAYGRLLGRIHRLSKNYVPAQAAWKRPAWDHPTMQFAELYLPAEQTINLAHYRELMAYLQSLPQEEDSFGMIHQDAHAGNLFVDEDYNLTLFDFDDCVYGHFAYDLAMVIFYAVVNEADHASATAALWQPFWRGYSEENELDRRWLAEIPHYMKLREIDLYAQLLNVYGEKPSGNQWADNFMSGRRALIEKGAPLVQFDFGSTPSINGP